VILALNLYFAQMNTALIVDLSSTLKDGVFVDFDGTVAPFARAVTDGILSSPYQSAALFVPLLVALVCGQEYRSGQLLISAAAVPSRVRLAAVKIAVAGTLGAAVTLVAFLLSDAVLLLLLPAEGRAVVLSATGLLVAAKVTLYAVVMAIVAGALTTLFRSTMPALITIVAVLVLALSGLLRATVPPAHDLLPMIAAKTFLFGYVSEPGDPSASIGVAVLLGWLGVATVAWLLVFRRRDIE
jgi:ABC-type transport system involved in multi-copper enzyme maturation permease subunit